MIRLFLGNRIGVLFLLPFMVGIFQYFHWLSGQENGVSHDFGLWGILSFPLAISYVLSGIFVFGNAIFLNYLYNSHQFLEKNSYLTSLLYVVAMSFYTAFYHFDYTLCVHFLFTAMLMQFFTMKQQIDVRRNVFNAFLFIGLASTLQPLLLLFFPFFVFALLIFRSFSLREILLAFFGYSLPFIYCLTYLWWFNLERLIEFDTMIVFSQLADFLWTLLAYGLMIIISYFSLRMKLQKSSVRLKKQIQSLWLFVLMGLFVGVMSLLWKHGLNDLSIAMLFLTSLLTYSFLHKTYGLLSTGVFYICMLYSMLKFFI